ncbi:MAG: hypothetical protein J6T01_04050 [Kiritimatiellae bacterium]|nr:hypothetical protein [Kiritimatiellia bacterium]
MIIFGAGEMAAAFGHRVRECRSGVFRRRVVAIVKPDIGILGIPEVICDYAAGMPCARPCSRFFHSFFHGSRKTRERVRHNLPTGEREQDGLAHHVPAHFVAVLASIELQIAQKLFHLVAIEALVAVFEAVLEEILGEHGQIHLRLERKFPPSSRIASISALVILLVIIVFLFVLDCHFVHVAFHLYPAARPTPNCARPGTPAGIAH